MNAAARHSPPSGAAAGGTFKEQRGFSLIEMVAVLAILAILAAIIGENVIQKMKQAARDAERTTLANLLQALSDAARKVQYLPGTAQWDDVLSTNLSRPLKSINLNRAGNLRVMVVDPALRIGPNTTSVLPYFQTVAGSREPVSPRILLVSSLAGPLPSLSSSDFTTLWNLGRGSVPSGWGASWANLGEDLIVERLDLGGLFHRVLLNNLEDTVAPYSIVDMAGATNVAANGNADFWLLDGTALYLHAPASGTLQAVEVISRDESFAFENDRWGGSLIVGATATSASFGVVANNFLAAPSTITSNQKGATAQAVAEEFYNYLRAYNAWAAAGWPNTATVANQQPTERAVKDAQARLGAFSYNLTTR